MATNEDEVTRLYGLFASASIASPCPVRCLDGSPGRARCCSHCLWSLSCPWQLPGGVRLVPPVCGTHGSRGHSGNWQSCPRAPGASQIRAPPGSIPSEQVAAVVLLPPCPSCAVPLYPSMLCLWVPGGSVGPWGPWGARRVVKRTASLQQRQQRSLRCAMGAALLCQIFLSPAFLLAEKRERKKARNNASVSR